MQTPILLAALAATFSMMSQEPGNELLQHQVQALLNGQTAASDFDFGALKFKYGADGEKALEAIRSFQSRNIKRWAEENGVDLANGSNIPPSAFSCAHIGTYAGMTNARLSADYEDYKSRQNRIDSIIDEQWETTQLKASEVSRSESHPYRRELIYRVTVDQNWRRGVDVMRQKESGIDLAVLNNRIAYEICEIDRGNTAAFKQLLSTYGWPTISEYGEDADRAGWLLVQHADHALGFQRTTLETLEPLAKSGDTNPRNFAMLWDRVAMNADRPQRYASQGRCSKDGVWEPLPTENPDKIDARRAEMGMSTLSKNVERLSKPCRLEKEMRDRLQQDTTPTSN